MAHAQRPTSSNGTWASRSLDRLIDEAARAITSVIGGFEAWKHDGFPIAPCSRAPFAVDDLPGTGPPE